MNRDEIVNEYFDWICHQIENRRYSKGKSYRKLLACLHSIEFVYLIPADENRVIDGCDLRKRFLYDCGYDLSLYNILDDPCSVLEMMVALCIRCEEQIMDDPDFGDRTAKWFWEMIRSLQLTPMTDRYFDKYYVIDRIQIFLDRDYQRDGSGGLFTITGCGQDLRNVEIWYQMCWYLDSIL